MADLANVKPDYIYRNARIDPETGCWIWLLKTYKGYGVTSKAIKATRMAHRLSYMVLVGPIPEGLTLDHLCRNRACVNPGHLEPVTMAENTRRAPTSASTICAAKTHCDSGHEFDEANTYRHKGGRVCRACNRAAAARYAARRAAAREAS